MLTIRACTADELPSLAAYLSQSAGPWSESQLTDALSRSQYSLRSLHLESNEADFVAGFLLCTIVADECNLLYIEVMPDQRNKGYGHTLMSDLIELATKRHCQTIHLEVRRSNLAAIGLYHSFGFIVSTTRRDYYPALPDSTDQNREDAVLMNLNLMLI